MKTIRDQEVFQGTGISRGIAVGALHLWDSQGPEVPTYAIKQGELDKERRRFQQAWDEAKTDLTLLREQLQNEGTEDVAAIIEGQIQLLEDPMLFEPVLQALDQRARNVEALLTEIVEEFRLRFEAMEDPYFRDRFQDLEDVKQRVLRHLLKESGGKRRGVPPGAIIGAQYLAPSKTAAMQSHLVAACITEKGGATSHAAIVAKAKGIPMVTGIDISCFRGQEGAQVIVDGVSGQVVVNPNRDTLAQYQAQQYRLGALEEQFLEQQAFSAETSDGKQVSLCANIEDPGEVQQVHDHHLAGVGLFRSEYLLLSEKTFPSEEKQFQAYRALAQGLEGLPLVVRVFDVGGDKSPDAEQGWENVNPYLSCRAIRFLLREKDVFRTQLRAILRASAYGSVKLLFPMVSDVAELREAKMIVSDIQEELSKAGQPFDPHIPIGTMIELPSAVMIADYLVAESDFLSIGTNDLIQYALAADRSDSQMGSHYLPTHPGVLRLIAHVIAEASKQEVPVSLCGEMAADPRYTALLLGLGVGELSVALPHVALIKHVIRRTQFVEARRLARQVMAMSTCSAIDDLLAQHYSLTVPEDCFTL